MKRFWILLLTISEAVTVCGQNAIILDMPAGTGTEDGNSESYVPFIANSVRYQQVYAASEFDVLKSSNGGWFEDIYFRVDATNGSTFGYSYTLQINLSVTPRGPDELSPVFSENVGTNETIVF